MNCVLTIAGSDSGGNAGVQADLRTFHAFGLHACTVLSALTAQNPFGVSAVHPIPADFIAAQLDAVMGTYSIAAMKTGMLGDSEAIEAIAERLDRNGDIAKVIDPVMVATSGAKLVSRDAIKTAEARLFPAATLITPNIPEAEVLTGMDIASREEVRDAAKRLYGRFGCAVLIKGGHAIEDVSTAEDTLFDGECFSSFMLPRIKDPVSTHGTGCTLSAAITAELALDRSLAEAVTGAKRYVHRAIEKSYLVGDGCGVLF